MALAAPIITDDLTTDVLDIGLPGGTLHTAESADSTARVSIGDVVVDEIRSVTHGVDVVFIEVAGFRGRQIIIEGEIRASTESLLAIYAARDDWRMRATTVTLTTDLGEDYYNCRIAAFEMSNKRKIVGNGTIEWYVPYRITLEQLEI